MKVTDHTVGDGRIGDRRWFCQAALPPSRPRSSALQVLIVDAGKSGFSGASAIGTHITRVVLPEDDHEAALKASVIDSDYMVDQEYAEGVIAESYDRFNQWLELGSNFIRDAKGEIDWIVGNTPNPFFKQRYAMYLPWNSHQHVTNVKNGALHLGASVLDRVVVTELLTSDGKVVGAVGINRREGDFYIFKAKAVVVATGPSGVSAGECAANHCVLHRRRDRMGLRAGAELRGMELSKADAGHPHKISTKARLYDESSPDLLRLSACGNLEVPLILM